MRIFFDIDGTLAEWRKCATAEQLYEKGYFSSLAPVEKVVHAAEELHKAGYEVYVLSAYMTDSAYAAAEKVEWVNRYLPWLPEGRVILVPVDKNKADYVPGGIQKDDILLDDYTKNLVKWESSKGTGVKCFNGVNGTKGTWCGSYTCAWLNPVMIVEDILRSI